METTKEILPESANKLASVTVNFTQILGPQRDELYIVVPITIVYILIFTTGLVGNIFTCFVIVKNRSMHTATYYYLLSLAISNLLLLLTGIPQEIYSIWFKWPYVFGASFCWLRGLASETSTNASVLTITLFTIDRYIAICHPFLSHKISNLSRALWHVSILWAMSFFLALPTALQQGIMYYEGIAMCLQTQVILEHSFEISTFVFFLAPMTLISVLCGLIGLRLKRINSTKNMHNESKYEMRQTPDDATRRMIKILVAVVVAFFVCWAPFHAQRLVAIYGAGEDNQATSPLVLQIYSILTYISGIFYYMTASINPILYHLISIKFRNEGRQAYKATVSKLCCCCSCQGSYTTVVLTREPSFSTTNPTASL